MVYLTACAIDPSTSNLPDQQKKKLLINNRAGEFIYLTYENLKMQMIHLQSIEESIIQAVGRSQYLRKTVEVIILNDYPFYLEAEEFKVTHN